MSDAMRGCWAALPSPIAPHGDLDLGLFVRHAQGLLAQGVDGVVAFGTTGEGTSFSACERLAGAEALLRSGIDPARIGLGCGFPAVADVVALGRRAVEAGLSHLLALPPYFYRDATPEGLEDAFAGMLDGINDDRVRLTLYHIPQVSGVPMPTGVATRLRARYGRLVAGIKDSSGDFSQFQAFRAAAADLAICVGHEPDIYRAVSEGGAGTICGLANIAPAIVRALISDASAEPSIRAIADAFKG